MLETMNNSDDLLRAFLSPEELAEQGIKTEEESENLDLDLSKVEDTKTNTLDVITDPSTLETNEESEDGDNNTETVGEYSYKAFVSHLSDEGLVDFELTEDAEDSPELLFESVKSTINKGINSYKESIPEVGKQFLEYLEKGGDPNKFIESFAKPFDVKTIDLNSEADQERVVKEYLKALDYTSEEIDETIQDYKDSLILEKQAGLASKKLEKSYSLKQEQLIKEQEQLEIQRQEQTKQYINTIHSTIDSSTEIAGLPISNKLKSEFKQYLLAADKEGLTKYQREVNENPVQTQLELAFLKFMKYDFSTAAAKGQTQATQKLKDIFKKTETSVKTGRSNDQAQEESDNFAAFRSFYNRK